MSIIFYPGKITYLEISITMSTILTAIHENIKFPKNKTSYILILSSNAIIMSNYSKCFHNHKNRQLDKLYDKTQSICQNCH